MLILLCFYSWIIVSLGSCLHFRLGSCFQSGMVLQSQAGARGATVWGWGQPGAEVEVELRNGTMLGLSRVGEEGRWSLVVMLPPGGPYSLSLHHRGDSVLPQQVRLDDVLAGDVWLCGDATT